MNMNAAELTEFLESPEEEMPLIGGASDGIRLDSDWLHWIGQLQGSDPPEVPADEEWPIDLNLAQSSAPAPVASSSVPAPMASISTPAPMAFSSAPAPTAFSSAPAPMAFSSAPAPMAFSSAPAPMAFSSAPAPMAFSSAPTASSSATAPMAFSSAPAPMTFSSGSAGHAGDILQWQYGPALYPAENIAKPPLLRESDWVAIQQGKLDVTNMTKKGKSVMVDEIDNKDALMMTKCPSVSSLAEPFRKDLRVIVDAYRRLKSTTKATKAKKRIASGGTKFDLNTVPHVGTSPVTNDQENNEAVVTGEEEAEEQHIVVPEPDFHDFDKVRTEAQVKKHQIWALYDETDSMPRFYCQIKKVTRSPFYVEGVWLEPLHPQTWLKERDLSNGAGDFKLGGSLKDHTIHMFSHLMESAKKKFKSYEVYPKRGEVWAIYADYEKGTEGKLKLRYEYVEIRSDFSALTGEGRVAKLHKLKGYTTLWTPDVESFQMTVKYDLHKFSHLVPALRVTEKDVPGLLQDCLELDPASTPPE